MLIDRGPLKQKKKNSHSHRQQISSFSFLILKVAVTLFFFHERFEKLVYTSFLKRKKKSVRNVKLLNRRINAEHVSLDSAESKADFRSLLLVLLIFLPFFFF